MEQLSRKHIKEIVNKSKLTFFGIIPLEENEAAYSHFTKWIKEKKHAQMYYLEKHSHCRKNPSNLLEKSKSAIICGFNYYQGDYYEFHPKQAKIAQYSRIKDYHKFMEQKGNFILNQIKKIDHIVEGKVCVDKLPILERDLAQRTESGFIGKNTMFIHSKKGSYFLLCEILLTIKLPYDEIEQIDHTKRSSKGGCGSCRRCITFCPSQALDQEYTLDANKCLAFHTIENRKTVPINLWPHFKHFFFGCDICQLVCPYNKKSEINESLPKQLKNINLFEVSTMKQTAAIS